MNSLTIMNFSLNASVKNLTEEDFMGTKETIGDKWDHFGKNLHHPHYYFLSSQNISLTTF